MWGLNNYQLWGFLLAFRVQGLVPFSLGLEVEDPIAECSLRRSRSSRIGISQRVLGTVTGDTSPNHNSSS